jgi:hypothetical protein
MLKHDDVALRDPQLSRGDSRFAVAFAAQKLRIRKRQRVDEMTARQKAQLARKLSAGKMEPSINVADAVGAQLIKCQTFARSPVPSFCRR